MERNHLVIMKLLVYISCKHHSALLAFLTSVFVLQHNYKYAKIHCVGSPITGKTEALLTACCHFSSDADFERVSSLAGCKIRS